MDTSTNIEWTLTVEGMTCDHCAKTIDAAVSALPGVVEVATDHVAGSSRVVAQANVGAAALASAIARKGFRVVRQVPERIVEPQGQVEALDLLIIGAGSAGFAAAIRASDLGKRVAIVERGALGGTCVNVGCVPSKTLIRAAEVQHRAAHHPFAGVHTASKPVDFSSIIAQKDDLVAGLQQAKYWDVLAAYPRVQLLQGDARFDADGTVRIDGQPVRASKVLLAMGARPWAPPIPGLPATGFLTSTTLMELTELPKHLIAIGGGAVGLELAQAFARFGSQVSVVEAVPRLVPAEDSDIGEALAGYLREEGLSIHTGARIVEIRGDAGAWEVEIERNERREVLAGDQLLVATGRRPNTADMGLQEAGIRLGKKGEVLVDEHLRTSLPHVYAAGDVIGDPAFVYVAAYAGNLAANNALGDNPAVFDLSIVPRVTFTDPAVASVGLSEAQAWTDGYRPAVSKLPMAYVPRAIAARDTRGFIKLVADADTNLLLGAHILAPEAGEMIEVAVMALRFGIRVDQIASLLHPYLTHAEGIKLACQTFDKDVAKLSCCAA